MAESMATRVGRIISGSANALIDAVENLAPEVVMEQAVREVDEAIDEVRAALGRSAANKHLAANRLMEENRKHEELGANIEVAVKEGRDDLAEAAIARQFDIEAQIPVLENTIADCQAQGKELEGYVAALQAKKREMQDALRQFIESRAHAAANAIHVGARTPDAKVDKAESAFDRVLMRHGGVTSGAAAVEGQTAAKLAELSDIARNNRVQERLAALKAKTGK